MLKLLTKKEKCKANFAPNDLDILLAKIAQIYRIDEIDKDRKKYERARRDWKILGYINCFRTLGLSWLFGLGLDGRLKELLDDPITVERIKILNRLSFNFIWQTLVVAVYNCSFKRVKANRPAVNAPPIRFPINTTPELIKYSVKDWLSL